jgi:beta-glucosidase
VEFLWGAATSSHQIEGYNENNDWWAWEALGFIEGGIRSGAATDHWNRFREDIRLAADLGLNSYRFSVEWSRVEPQQGRWDDAAFEWYENLIAECERHRLIPMLTLHHFTSPRWFAVQGGFTHPHSPVQFAQYVRKVATRIGARVPLWCTVNEPMVLIAGTYLGKFMPPAQFAPHLVPVASHNLLKAHVRAYDILHSELKVRSGPWKDLPLQVGIAHNMLDFLPDRSWHPMERVLTAVFHRFYNRAWLDAVTGRKQRFGVPGLIPKAIPVSEALGRNTSDFIGVNYYTKAYVQWRPKQGATEGPSELPIGASFARRKEPVSDLGWAIHPKGFERVLKFAASYGVPLYVTENGIADRSDSQRGEYIRTHLEVLQKLSRTEVDIRGYYYWSLLDNFEWIKGFWPRFGLYQVNYENFERTATESALLYKSLIQAFRS